MVKIIVKNSKGKIVKFIDGWCWNKNLVEIIKISDNVRHLLCYHNKLTYLPELPKSLEILICNNNKIEKLPDLRECDNLEYINCDICCFEPYMLEMKNINFEFYC